MLQAVRAGTHEEGEKIGYFLSVVGVIVTMFWTYRGLRRGLYPALNIFLVFCLALLVTLNYYDLMFALVGKIAPQSGMKVRECIAFISGYMIVFTFFLYFCLWLCAEKLPIHNVVDSVGGGIFGIMTGVVCGGVMMMMWFHMPFAERNYPVSDGEMFFPCHTLTMRGISFAGDRISGGKKFHGVRYLRDVRYGLPRIPSVGKGYYVTSIPTGLRVFIKQSGGYSSNRSKSFIADVKGYLGKRGKVPPSEKERIGDYGYTPVFIPSEASSTEVAIVMDRIPSKLKSGTDIYVHDGESNVSAPSIGEQGLVIRVYKVSTDVSESVGAMVALFHPAEERFAYMVEDSLPTRKCFTFDTERMVQEMMEHGATHEEAEQLAIQVGFGGKAYFKGTGGIPQVVEMIAPGDWDIYNPDERFESIDAEDADTRRGSRR